MISHDAVARGFEQLSRAGKRTWQQGKRATHQPQLESLIAHLELLGLVPPLDGSPAPEATVIPPDAVHAAISSQLHLTRCPLSPQGRARTVVAELGAGKGMFGRIISELTGAPTIAIERRVVKSNYDAGLKAGSSGASAGESGAIAAVLSGEVGQAEEEEAERHDAEIELPDSPLREAEAAGSAAAAETVRITADLRDCDLGKIIAEATADHEVSQLFRFFNPTRTH